MIPPRMVREEASAPLVRMTYCVIPAELAPELHELLRRFFRDEPNTTVIVERRDGDRRERDERRSSTASRQGAEQRLIRGDRRVADRRSVPVPAGGPELPRRARAYAHRLRFLVRLEPSSERLEDIDTARLVTKIQAGERDLFAALYERYFERVYRYLLVILGKGADAEDGVQQVFMNVLAALPRYERREQPFRAWLFRIARNHALDQLRDRQRIQAVEPAQALQRADQADTVRLSDLSWLRDSELMMFVERLPLAQRQVLMLRFTADLSHDEIASILGRSPESVRMLQVRALAFLRHRLSAIGHDARCLDRARMRRWPREATVLRARRWVLLR